MRGGGDILTFSNKTKCAFMIRRRDYIACVQKNIQSYIVDTIQIFKYSKIPFNHSVNLILITYKIVIN